MADQSFSFSKSKLQSLLPAKSRYRVHDKKQPGLALRVQPTGAKSYYVYRRAGGQVVDRKLGSLEELSLDAARKEAARIIGQLATGQELAPRSARGGETFGMAFDDRMECWSKTRKQTWREDQRKFDRHLAHWRNRKLRELRRADVAQVHEKIRAETAKRTGKSGGGLHNANRVLTLIKSVFSWAERSEEFVWSGPSPARYVEPFPERSRERWLESAEERRRVLRAITDAPEPYRDLFLLCVFTGARIGNVLAMRWADVDLPLSRWRIPKTKNGSELVVELMEPAVRVLMSRSTDCDYVFPANTRSGHLSHYLSGWRDICKVAGVTNLRPHDLRRTLGSLMASNGASLHQIGQVLGHKDGRSTQVYARLADTAKRSAMEAILPSLELKGGE